ncbi:MAG: hypothetical protein NC548_28585 [Lachnospiraceae bacterium]|nr:hypothetical protein [Lachnospiraceae bacterium]
MNKIIKHGIWMSANIAALPAVAVLSAVTGDKKETVTIVNNISKHASKIGKQLSKDADHSAVEDDDKRDV